MSSRRSRYRTFDRLSVICFVASIAPLAISYLASVLADLLGCEFDTSGPSTCVVFGVDVSGPLGTALFLHLAVFVTFPIGIVLGIIFLVLSGFAKVAEDKQSVGESSDD